MAIFHFLGTLLLAVLLVQPCFAGDANISGAFGYSLGEALHPLPSDLTYEGYPILRFAPNDEQQLFTTAQLRVAPDTGRIFDISALTIFPDKAAAEAALAQLKETLESRYGKTFSRTVGQGVLYSITRNKRRLLFYIRESIAAEGWQLYINYADLELYRKARLALSGGQSPVEALGMRPRRR